MKTSLAINLLFLTVLLTGCVGLLPVPPSRREPAHGKVITRADVKFIVPGRTTRDEVIARLGDQFRDSPRLPVLAYAWEKPAVGVMWGFMVAAQGGAGAGGGHAEASHWRAFFVLFDPQGRVAATKFVCLTGRRSLDEQLEDWAVGKTHHLEDIASTVPQLFECLRKNTRVEAGP